MSSTPRTVVWFSCGAASAIAAKIAVGTRPRVEVCYCDTSRDEHEDNARFLADVERWIGRSIARLSHPKWKTVEEVQIANKFITGPMGAPCTKHLKRWVRDHYSQTGDVHVLGYTSDEHDRAAEFNERNDLLTWWPLIEAGITKDDCYKILQSVGIALPTMYLLGFNNNNCIGCVKGGMGYWNKVRVLFPDRFALRARTERVIGATSLRNSDDTPLFLDELDPNAGRDVPEPDIECGLFCGQYTKLINVAVHGQAVSA